MSPAIPKDSLVLVTGANGFIASHVVDQFLQAGYRVRGTTRDLKKLEDVSSLWESQHGKGRFEAVVVPDMAVQGAFDSAMKGTNACFLFQAIMLTTLCRSFSSNSSRFRRIIQPRSKQGHPSSRRRSQLSS